MWLKGRDWSPCQLCGSVVRARNWNGTCKFLRCGIIAVPVCERNSVHNLCWLVFFISRLSVLYRSSDVGNWTECIFTRQTWTSLFAYFIQICQVASSEVSHLQLLDICSSCLHVLQLHIMRVMSMCNTDLSFLIAWRWDQEIQVVWNVYDLFHSKLTTYTESSL